MKKVFLKSLVLVLCLFSAFTMFGCNEASNKENAISCSTDAVQISIESTDGIFKRIDTRNNALKEKLGEIKITVDGEDIKTWTDFEKFAQDGGMVVGFNVGVSETTSGKFKLSYDGYTSAEIDYTITYVQK